MDDKGKDQRMERRTSAGDASRGQSQEGKNRSFVSGGLEHFNYKNPSSVITVAVVGFFIFSGGVVLSAYLAGSGKVEQIVYKTAIDAAYDRKITIREKFESIDKQIIEYGYDIRECKKLEPRIDWLESYQSAPTKGKRK